jgi:hypothetical protein
MRSSPNALVLDPPWGHASTFARFLAVARAEGGDDDDAADPASVLLDDGAPRPESRRPRLVILDRRVVCHGRYLDLKRRPLTLRLFKAFCSAPHGRLSRREVAAALYDFDPGARSERYVESLQANCTKLVSRARLLATETFGPVTAPTVRWLPFDARTGTWQLWTTEGEGPSHLVSVRH